MPDLAWETAFASDLGLPTISGIAGVDEVGRGALAGPVMACAAMLPPGGLPLELGQRIDDSKKLSPAKRMEIRDQLLAAGLRHGLGAATVAEIADLNILQASFLAMRRAVAALTDATDAAGATDTAPQALLVDGNRDPGLDLPTRLLVRGDRRSLVIAAASILAKVARDRHMADLAAEHPAYGWGRNAGYGTPDHLLALSWHGPTDQHRSGFAPVARLL